MVRLRVRAAPAVRVAGVGRPGQLTEVENVEAVCGWSAVESAAVTGCWSLESPHHWHTLAPVSTAPLCTLSRRSRAQLQVAGSAVTAVPPPAAPAAPRQPMGGRDGDGGR